MAVNSYTCLFFQLNICCRPFQTWDLNRWVHFKAKRFYSTQSRWLAFNSFWVCLLKTNQFLFLSATYSCSRHFSHSLFPETRHVVMKDIMCFSTARIFSCSHGVFWTGCQAATNKHTNKKKQLFLFPNIQAIEMKRVKVFASLWLCGTVYAIFRIKPSS